MKKSKIQCLIFNLSENLLFQVVAIMGAHSLGGASGASGWDGTFTGTDTNSKSRNHFDENYYAQMVDPKFKWTNVVS